MITNRPIEKPKINYGIQMLRMTPFLMICSMLFGVSLGAQPDTVQLAEVLNWAEQNYAFDHSIRWEEDIGRLKAEQLEATRYPSFSLRGEVSYQSEVVDFPFEIPMVQPLDLPHLRTRLNLQIDQVLFDGGITTLQKQLVTKSTQVKKEEINMRREAVRDRLVGLYFNLLLLQNTRQTIISSIELLNNKRESLQAAVEGGIVMSSDLLELEAELTDLSRDSTQQEHRIKGLKDMIGTLLDRNMEDVVFSVPEVSLEKGSTERSDPQLRLFDRRKEGLEISADLAQARIRPKITAYAQGGLAYPNPLNFFEDDLSPYFTTGLRLAWPIWDWDQHQKEQDIMQMRSHVLDNASRHRKIEIHSMLDKYRAEIKYLQKSLEKDRESVQKRQHIRKIKSLRLDKGVIHSNDYLEAVHRERAALLLYHRHRIESAQAKVHYLLESGDGLNE